MGARPRCQTGALSSFAERLKNAKQPARLGVLWLPRPEYSVTSLAKLGRQKNVGGNRTMHGTHLAARKLQRIRAHAGAAFLALAVCGLGAAPARAEAIKVGTTKLSSTAPLFIAIDKGYFAAEGLAAEVVILDAAQPVSMG